MGGGATIKGLQSEFNVRIIMPREDGGPIQIEGAEDPAFDCKDKLLDIEEEWAQEEDEYNDSSEYVKPEREWHADPPKLTGAKAQAFAVKNAPWQSKQLKDGKSFPGLGG